MPSFSATPSIYQQGQLYLRFPHEPHENEFIPFRVIPFDSWAEKAPPFVRKASTMLLS
jgi:hypothetical protein